MAELQEGEIFPPFNPLAVRMVFGFFVVVFDIIAIVGLVLFCLKKRDQPIKARAFKVVLLSQILLIIYVTGTCFKNIFMGAIPCAVNFFALHVPIFFMLNAYVLRVWLLYIRATLTIKKANFRWHPDAKETKMLDWLLRHQYLVRANSLWTIYVVITVLENLVPTIFVFIFISQGRYIQYDYKCSSTAEANQGLTLIFAIVTGAFLIFAVWKVRNKNDGFFIKTEFKIVSVTLLIGACLYVGVSNLEVSKKRFPIDSLVLMITSAGMFCATVWLPLFKAFRSTPGNRRKTWRQHLRGLRERLNATRATAVGTTQSYTNEGIRLMSVLQTPSGRHAFSEHLKKEFSIENLLYWEAVSQFSQTYANRHIESLAPEEQDRMNEAAVDIYIQFMLQNAPLWVNLAGYVTKEVTNELRQIVVNFDEILSLREQPVVDVTELHEKLKFRGCVSPNIFESAVKDVFALMEVDSFSRFNIRSMQNQVQLTEV